MAACDVPRLLEIEGLPQGGIWEERMMAIKEAECKRLIGHCWIVVSQAFPTDKPRERTCQHCRRKEVETSAWEEFTEPPA